MSVLISPGIVGCPDEASPPAGYTSPWRIDPATKGWWLPKPASFSAGGGAFVTTGATPLNSCTLNIPVQGVPGLLHIWALCLLGGTVAGDTVDAAINVVGQGYAGREREAVPASGTFTATPHGVATLDATPVVIFIEVSRQTGTGVISTTADPSFHALRAIFIPN